MVRETMKTAQTRRIFRLLGLSFIFFIFSCERNEPIRIGFVGELSGSNADIGEAGRNGAMLAVERANAAGGIKGRKIELIVRDDLSTAEGAAAAVRDVVEAKAEVILGPFNTAMADAVLPLAEKAGLVAISPTVSAYKFVGKDDNLIRLNSSTRDNAGYYAEFLASRRGAPGTTLIYDLKNKGFTESWVEEFVATYEKLGGKTLAKIPFNAALEQGFGEAVREALGKKPGCVIFVANGVDSARLAQLVRKTNRDVLLGAAEWAATEQLIQLGGGASEGLFELQTYDAQFDGADWKTFLDEYRKRFRDEPSFAAVASYDATTALFKALGERKQGEKVKEAFLRVGTYKGLQQEIVFDRFGDTKRKPTFTEIRSGRYVKAPK